MMFCYLRRLNIKSPTWAIAIATAGRPRPATRAPSAARARRMAGGWPVDPTPARVTYAHIHVRYKRTRAQCAIDIGITRTITSHARSSFCFGLIRLQRALHYNGLRHLNRETHHLNDVNRGSYRRCAPAQQICQTADS